MNQEKKGFMNIDGDEGFQNRAKSIFESLDSLEPPKEDEKVPSREMSRAHKRRRPNQVPDHVLHPEKWTQYSLEEDGSENLGRLSANEVNRHAALSFLNELKDRRKPAESSAGKDKNATDSPNDHDQHTFAKPSDDTERVSSDNRAPASQKQGVTVMPEYVIGKTKPQHKTKKLEPNSPPSSSSQQAKVDVQISHLLQAEQESDLSDQKDKETPDKEKFTFSKRKHRESKNIRKHKSSDDDE